MYTDGTMVDPLHGVTLETMLNELVEAHGFAGLAESTAIRCFSHEPTISSSLKFLRRTPWARAKVERLYVAHVRRAARRERRRVAKSRADGLPTAPQEEAIRHD